MSDQVMPEELDFDPTLVPEPSPEIDLRTYFQTLSAKGKHAMRQEASEGETMQLAPIGFKTSAKTAARSSSRAAQPLPREAEERSLQIAPERC
jgi:hypothetical protein